MKLDNQFGSNYGGLDGLLNGHESGFPLSCMTQVYLNAICSF